MCGFAGVVDFLAAIDPDGVARMSASIAHRGPDADGMHVGPCAVLSARRLAIIDLSAAGEQPFADPTGRYFLLFNGEVYNYREVRAELETKGWTFRSQTDTEVVLTAFLEWGEACVERFNGMWAFAIWDREGQTLFCSRDRFGEKPLYYQRAGDRLVFASELKAFRHAGLPLAPNDDVVRDFLAYGLMDHRDETFFADIFQLAPGHSMTFSSRGLSIRRYWALELQNEPGANAETVRELILDSLRLRLRSDVSLGTCLSGGLDSSTIVCGVDHLFRTEHETTSAVGSRLKTFTAYFDDPAIDERGYAQAVNQKVGADAHLITFSDRDAVEALPAIVEAQDEPFRSTTVIAQWYVMKAAREAGLKVMLDGQGGDELFAGYTGHIGFFFATLLREGRISAWASELAAAHRVRGMRVGAVGTELMRPLVPQGLALRARARATGAAALLGPRLRDRRFEAPTPTRNLSDPFRRRVELVARSRLPELLHYEDRNSMTHSLEARVPFLDHRLAQVVFSLGADQIIRGGTTKFVLREAMRGILPPIVRDRRTKLGFDTPEATWFQGALGQLAQEVFHSRSAGERGLVDVSAAKKAFRSGWRGARGSSALWRALCVELWARAFLDG